MRNSGFKIVAWIGKVDRFTGEPVDKDGAPTSESGQPQEVYVAREIYGDLPAGAAVYIDDQVKYVGGTYSITPEGTVTLGTTIVVNGVPVYYYTGECLEGKDDVEVTAEWLAGVCEFNEETKIYTGYERYIKLRVTQTVNGTLKSTEEYSLTEYMGLSLRDFAALSSAGLDAGVQAFLTHVSQQEGVNLNDFYFTNTVTNYNTECFMFKGAIMMYSGLLSGIPAQWFICDGTGGRPDFRGRSPIGYIHPDADITDINNPLQALFGIAIYDATYRTLNAKIGEKKHILSVNELAQHTHKHGGDPTNSSLGFVVAYGSAGVDNGSTSRGLGENGREYPKETASTGSSAAHENRQPSTVVAFIMYDPDAQWNPY
jgi:hypothetical protein